MNPAPEALRLINVVLGPMLKSSLWERVSAQIGDITVPADGQSAGIVYDSGLQVFIPPEENIAVPEAIENPTRALRASDALASALIAEGLPGYAPCSRPTQGQKPRAILIVVGTKP